MKWMVLAMFLLVLGGGCFFVHTDGLLVDTGLTLHAGHNMQNAQIGALYARVDSLNAYVGNLFVRVDRLEVLEGL